MTEINVRIEGLDELIRKLEPTELAGEPVRQMFEKSAITVRNNVIELTPRDQGQLAQSVHWIMDSGAIPMWAEVSTSLQYAPFVEFDTRPHWPPIEPIALWAERHGMVPFLVARAIARHGTKGHHMFEQGLEQSRDAIDGYVDEAARKIEENFGA